MVEWQAIEGTCKQLIKLSCQKVSLSKMRSYLTYLMLDAACVINSELSNVLMF